MPWQLFYCDNDSEPCRTPGAMWWYQHDGKMEWAVSLPGGGQFTSETARRGGWTVTGKPPFITVHPSINAIGSYHGWIRDGQLSDDVEGRTFTAREGRTG